MKIEKTKYRILALALTLLYVNFFIFSTYFHHHHPEKGIAHVDGEMVFCSLDVECCDEVTDQHLDDHTHNFEICFVHNVFSSKNNQSLNKIDTHSTFSYLVEDVKTREFKNPTSESISLLHWAKFVHTAANVSPPQV